VIDKVGVAVILVVVGCVLLSGCATEHASKLTNMDKWQANCANAEIERHLFLKNIILLEQSNLEADPVSREKVARLNELLLESDRLCGANGFYSQQS
tara:strand:- start:118 stop:408 length:291 start_codon:yes stop_codon:yes gene_type:complete